VADGVADLPRGTNQQGMRAFNEKLILTLIRSHGALAKSDLTRLTGLSAQTISVIVRSLENDALIRRGEPQRGRIGQPSVPLSINPQGAYFLGLKIGRRSAELVLIDFLGQPLRHLQATYDYPTPPAVMKFATEGVGTIRGEVPADIYARVAGLGVAMPFELWNWADMIGADRGQMDAWRGTDIRAELSHDLPFPVYVENDATSACGAELVFGGRAGLRDFFYFYIGSFIGGGIVLNGSLYRGRTGNAGALGSMLVADGQGAMRQLIDLASIHSLEERLKAEGRDPRPLWASPHDWGNIGPSGETWIATASAALARAIISATAVIDFESAVIDGWMPEDFRARLVDATRRAMQQLDAEGIALPDVQEGHIGAGARVIGAASLPLSDRFMIDQNAFS
jgi:predicted NBD/HSP70 family sugar kinase